MGYVLLQLLFIINAFDIATENPVSTMFINLVCWYCMFQQIIRSLIFNLCLNLMLWLHKHLYMQDNDILILMK